MNKFRAVNTDKSFEGHLKYSSADGLALVYESSDPAFQHSEAHGEFMLAKTLSLEFIKESGRLLSIEGYCPKSSWVAGVVAPPEAEKGEVMAVLDDYKIVSGAAIPLDGLEEAKIVFDESTGWIRIGEPFAAINIEIANDIVVGLSAGILKVMWLKPELLS